MSVQINMKPTFLKVKAKSLAEEAKIIRKEERRVKRIPWDKRKTEWKYTWGRTFTDPVDHLYHHRVWDVRNEARATHLARTYMAGHDYSRAEKKCKNPHMRDYYILPRVVKMLQKYFDSKITKDDVGKWVDSTDNSKYY